jgi:hypothetical protein
MAGYSGTPLVNKIGIKAGHRLLLLNAPKDFAATLGELPEGVEKVARGKQFDVAIVFVTSAAEFEQRVEECRRLMDQAGMIWAAWPKKSSGVATDLVEGTVQKIGLAAGLVDTKVCAIDEIWSGLKFVIRVADRHKDNAVRQKATKAGAK